MKKRSLRVESDVLPMTTQLHSILENDLSWKFYFYLSHSEFFKVFIPKHCISEIAFSKTTDVIMECYRLSNFVEFHYMYLDFQGIYTNKT